ncbi:MAG: dCTP deaminase [bacterium]
MSTICDHQIAQYAKKGLIDPFNESQVNPASYDVRLNGCLLLEHEPDKDYPEESLKCDCRWVKHICDQGGYVLKPGEFVLGCTEEFFNVPPELEAVFQLKSSRGREGFEHVLSGYIDPGFSGRLTLELVNVNRYHDLLLLPGMLIGQVRFMKLDERPRKDYSQTGHYQNDTNVQYSKVDVFGNQAHDQELGSFGVSIAEAGVFPES